MSVPRLRFALPATGPFAASGGILGYSTAGSGRQTSLAGLVDRGSSAAKGWCPVTDFAELSVSDHLQNLLLESNDVQEFLAELTTISSRCFSSLDPVLCAITLLRHRKAGTVASNSEQARKMDELQYAFAEGPCLSAAAEQVTIVVPEVTTEQRWPEYMAAVLGHGIRSVLAVPFQLDGEARAAMNLYSTQPDKFDAPSIETAEAFVRECSDGLRLAIRFAQHADTARNLRAALASRTTIDLAVGIVMGQNRCGQEEAVRILQSASSHRNTKLRDVAAALVLATGQGPAQTHFEG